MEIEEDGYYLVDRPEPSEEFLYARRIAIARLQRQFDLKRGNAETEHADFHYIRTALTSPSFDDISFGYKNKVFSVFIDFVDDMFISMTPEGCFNTLIHVANDNDLIPCLFPIRLSDMKPISDGWNLYHALTKAPVIPDKIAGNEPAEISEWEYNNWAINIVMNYLGEDTGKILSFCDAPGILPQIWFENNNNEECWILVKYSVYPNIAEMDKDFVPPRMILGNKGYFAGVSFCYADERSPEKRLFRNSQAFIRYLGLQEIWDGKIDLTEGMLQ